MAAPWWRGAVVYQVYVRSFCDSDADGQGDLPGLTGKLDYIAKLGVDAIWLSPIHPSPNRDWGYDVSDYDSVHPDYGSLADFDRLLTEAHGRGLKIILDEVLCHTSDEHPWFRESLKSASGPKSDWYVWATPRLDGTAPNNWLSAFGGAAWSYQPARRQHYHHKFLRQQPKFNWRNPDAKAAALAVLDFWLKLGADGFRLDVANAFLHDASLRDNPPVPLERRTDATWAHAAYLQQHVHDSNLPENMECLNEIRHVVERYDDRFVFGEFSEGFERSGAYEASDVGLHSGYTFALLRANRLSPEFVLKNIATLARHPRHWPCISFSNHDIVRTVTRFGGPPEGEPALAKLLLAVLLALRCTPLLYQGEELGLTEVDLRRDELRDPVGDLYYPVSKGRDGCRTPMPWDANAPNLGFSSGRPWLPPGSAHRSMAVSEQEREPSSVLQFARSFLKLRRTHPALKLGDISAVEAKDPVLAFVREHEAERLLCVFNLSRERATFHDTRVAAATPVSIDCGAASAAGEVVELGPLSAWLGTL
jgi:alpha-glucosidase